MYTPPARVPAAPPREPRGGSPRPPSRPPVPAPNCAGPAGSARRATASCSTSSSTRWRVGLLVHPVERRHAAALQQLGDLLVGEDHQVLDQPVGLGLLDSARSHDGPVRVELELGLERLDLQRGDLPAVSPSAAAARAGKPERLAHLGRRVLGGRRRSRRAGRSRGGRRSGRGCDRSSPNAARRRPRPGSRRSRRGGPPRAPGCRLHRSAPAGSIGSTVPGT